MNIPLTVRGFEQWATIQGAGRGDIGDAGAHRASEHVSRKQWKRLVIQSDARSAQVVARRETLRTQYAELVKIGVLVEMTGGEIMVQAASGHEDNAATQAARRVLAKRAARQKLD